MIIFSEQNYTIVNILAQHSSKPATALYASDFLKGSGMTASLSFNIYFSLNLCYNQTCFCPFVILLRWTVENMQGHLYYRMA